MTTKTFDEVLGEKIRQQIEEIGAESKKASVEQEPTKAELQQAGVLAPITQLEVFGIPLGQAGVGGITALAVSELVDAFITPPPEGVPFTRVLVKGIAAFGINQWLGGVMGRDAARVAALFIGFDLLRDLLPIDSWVQGLVTGITHKGASSSSSSYSSGSSSSHSSNGHQPDGMALLASHLGAAGR